MRILVTGGAGFLGSHLCRALVSQGHLVICADDFSSSTGRNISDLKSAEGFEILGHDITRPLHIKVDQIYNLACPASPLIYQADPIKTTKTSVMGAINMLDLAVECKSPILQASTSEVYGDPEMHPQPETYQGRVNPVGPRACYDEGKRCAECLFFDYHRQYNVQIRIARIFNTFGPGMDSRDGRVIPNFITQALNHSPVTIYGDGMQTRSFCYVTDMVDGLIRLMNTPGPVTGPVNIGNPCETTIGDLAQAVIRLTGSKSIIAFHDMPPDDPMQRKPDITQAKTLLGWEPLTSLETGLRKTIGWFQGCAA